MKRARGQSAPLEAAGRTAAAQLAHKQAEIEGARVDQQAFEDIAMPAQVRAAHPARVVDVRERPLHVLPASTQPPLTAPAAHPPPIAVHGPLRVRGRRPLAPAPIRLRDVGPDPDGVQIDQGLIAVIALVGDERGERPRRGRLGLGGRRLFDRGDDRV